MKQLLFGLLFCCCIVRMANTQTAGAAAPGPTNNLASTNQILEITNSLATEYDGVTGIAVFHGDVFVNDPQMTINCDILTVFFERPSKTNAVPGTPAPKPVATKPGDPVKPGGDSGLGMGNKIESIIAEGIDNSVVLVQKKDNSVAIGKKAVYTKAIDTVVLTGDPVVETPTLTTWAPKIVYDHANSKFSTTGGGRTLINTSSRTNLNSKPKPSKPTEGQPSPIPGK